LKNLELPKALYSVIEKNASKTANTSVLEALSIFHIRKRSRDDDVNVDEPVPKAFRPDRPDT
jgi:hypothetical protein